MLCISRIFYANFSLNIYGIITTHFKTNVLGKEQNNVSGLTSFSQVFTSFRFCERGHLIELGVDPGVFKAAEVDTFAVNNTV